MKSETSKKKCHCIHCQEKLEQINRSREYWSKVIEIQFKG